MNDDPYVRDDILQAARMYPGERAAAQASLERLFAGGHPPEPALDGRYRGMLLTTTTLPWLDRAIRSLTRRWLPWQGKFFEAKDHRGDNVFGNEGLWLARLLFPRYRHHQADGPDRSRALQFRTFIGPGQHDPLLTTLHLDYDLPLNPRFAVRRIHDEAVQVAPGVVLGKAYIRWRGRYRLFAWFMLEAAEA